MNPDDYAFLSDLVKSRSGLVLTNDKVYLLESRLMPVARKRNMKGLEELVRALRARPDEGLARDVTEAMTTNESFFFRDIKPFDLFRNTVLPGFRESRAATRSIRIWSAAASSGQEPYTIAMVLKEEAAKLADWRIEILGTDISGEMLAKARAGVIRSSRSSAGCPSPFS